MAKSSETEKTRGNPLASAEEKEKALEAARLQIEKQFGSGSLMKLGAHINAAGIESIPSGSILLDEALGIGGYPRGRIIEIYGPESSGKTTLALHAIAEAQKMKGIAAFVDAEHALDPVYARNLGVNIDDLWISQPDTGEQALEIAESLVRSGAVDVIVVDSVAALTPQAEIEGDMGDAHVGLQARLMSQALRKLTATIGKSRTILIFINQTRMKIGVVYGNPETTTGGNALKFYASVRLEVRKTETIEKADADAIGNWVRVKVVKNKMAPPFRRVEMEIIFGKGISALGSLLDAAVKYNIIDKKGAWYSWGEERIGQGRDNAKAYIEERPDFAKEIELKLRKLMFPGRDGAPAKPGASGKPSAPASGTAAAAPASDPSGVTPADPGGPAAAPLDAPPDPAALSPDPSIAPAVPAGGTPTADPAGNPAAPPDPAAISPASDPAGVAASDPAGAVAANPVGAAVAFPAAASPDPVAATPAASPTPAGGTAAASVSPAAPAAKSPAPAAPGRTEKPAPGRGAAPETAVRPGPPRRPVGRPPRNPAAPPPAGKGEDLF